MLKFSFENSKLNKLASYLNLRKNQVAGFDLPAGYTCKMAKDCKSFANRKTGKITDGPNIKFRCYAAGSESRFPNSRLAHWHNYDTLHGKTYHEMVDIINESLPDNIKIVRIHSSGDYFNQDYFSAWCRVAYEHPEITFFGYTKHIKYVRFVREMNLPNFKLVYSLGGKEDDKVTDEPTIKVITDAEIKNSNVACVNHPADDYDFIMAGESFSIVVHGTQPKKSR